MNDDILKNVENFNKKSAESMNDLVKLNTSVLNEILERQVELTNLCITENKKQTDLLNKTDKPEDLLKTQSELASQYGNKLMEITKQNMELATKTGEKYKKLMEKNFKA